MKVIAFIFLSVFTFNLHAAELNIVATTTSMAMLARTVGAHHVNVTVLATPDRDAHFLQARPSMIKALRHADLVVAVGAELEIGWLPLAIERAANQRIQIGQSGYFEAAAQVSLLASGAAADRALGDVHPAGNPHVNLDPQRMALIAQALAHRLAALDKTHADNYHQHADAFTLQINTRLPHWRAQVKNAPGVIMHHKDGDYLLDLLNITILGYIENVPGIPPSPSHLQNLWHKVKQYPNGVIIRAPFHPPQGADFLARELGWRVHVLSLDPPLDAHSDDYFALIDQWVKHLSAPLESIQTHQ
jgi:zinc/manganese transport system substrate-binding protein